MPRTFNGTTHAYKHTLCPITGNGSGWTVAAVARGHVDDAGTIFSAYNPSTIWDYIQLKWGKPSAGARAISKRRFTSGIANSGSALIKNKWNFLAGKFTSTVSRTAYSRVMRGATSLSSGTNTTSVIPQLTNSDHSIGALQASSDYFDGEIGWVAAWNTLLTTYELNTLADGAPPFMVDAENLVMLYPMWGLHSLNEIDLWGSRSIAPVATNAPLYDGGPSTTWNFWTPLRGGTGIPRRIVIGGRVIEAM